ncbi:unnamed protein product [marine sediment metagenome]|uniref:Uncharacterized protein n=1 Tax=marine sediment metagenome TaxID=412755 RepID=X0WCN7_9ZZZZ
MKYSFESVGEKHQLKIAKSTLKMSEVGARIMGGMTHKEAREIIKLYKQAKRS